jgi:hypothetical protein
VQSTRGSQVAGYTTNFVDISPPIFVPGFSQATTNYLDPGAAYVPVLPPPSGTIGATSGLPSTVSISAANTRGLADYFGGALPIGSLLMVGSFSISEPTIQSNFAAGNLGAIMAAFTPYGTSFTVGEGTDVAASWDVSLSEAGFGGRQIYLLAVNQPSLGSATQMGIFTAPSWIFPGAGSTIAIDLDSATDFVIGAQGGPLTVTLTLGDETYTFSDTARLSILPGRFLYYRVRLGP